MAIKIAINGFGRIGRCVLRAIFEQNMIKDFDIVAINGPAEPAQHAHLLSFDSIHGRFAEEVSFDESHLIVAGKKIRLFREREVKALPWKELGVEVVMECSGVFTSKEKAGEHLAQGAKKVIISAPAKEKEVKTIVFGVNNEVLTAKDELISIGSCTTNCLAPLAKVLDEKFGIEKGFMTTIHAYTGDQNVVDGSHKDLRRARSAPVSMVPTSTGAAKALGLVLPQLAGKLDGSAIRVPVPNVSVVDLCFTSRTETTIEEVNATVKSASNAELRGVLGYEPRPLVSVDFTHSSYSSIFDALETKVTGGNFVRVLSWYDNEWGFSVRMLEVAKLWTSLK